ncbi:hypothetical protein A0H81_14582 [Grifola frondosa]|uniref:Uncharacterized protein n=1 Tax=Grifola frondosa TaxID=5627 RepID=A0A1C7LL17_GRIFR|nr:hypothetical protein A0H81_14582 [Grifola frondosa]
MVSMQSSARTTAIAQARRGKSVRTARKSTFAPTIFTMISIMKNAPGRPSSVECRKAIHEDCHSAYSSRTPARDHVCFVSTLRPDQKLRIERARYTASQDAV